MGVNCQSSMLFLYAINEITELKLYVPRYKIKIGVNEITV